MGDELRLSAQINPGPNTDIRLTEWIENVPVKDESGHVIGRAKISDTGMIHAVIDIKELSGELFALVMAGVSDGLSIAPAISTSQDISYSEEVRRRFDKANAPHQKEDVKHYVALDVPTSEYPKGSECPVHKRVHDSHGWYVCIEEQKEN